MATHSSILAWRIPWTEKPDGLQSTGSRRVGHNWTTSLSLSLYGPNILGSYAILLFTALDVTSITSHIHSWVLFLLWLHLFILSRVISPLISSNILGTYWPGEFRFQHPILLHFHTVNGVLKARTMKWFAIPFSSVPHFVRILYQDPSILGGPTQHGSSHNFIELDKAVVHVIRDVRVLYILSQHLQIVTILLLPFQFGLPSFLYLAWLLCLELLYYIK